LSSTGIPCMELCCRTQAPPKKQNKQCTESVPALQTSVSSLFWPCQEFALSDSISCGQSCVTIALSGETSSTAVTVSSTTLNVIVFEYPKRPTQGTVGLFQFKSKVPRKHVHHCFDFNGNSRRTAILLPRFCAGAASRLSP